MKLCILGDGLVSLSLAKALVNEGIFVDVVRNRKNSKSNKTRTIGISKNNIDFINKNILNIKKLLWNINKIEVFSENLENKKILNFENDNQEIFSIIKNDLFYDQLILSLKKNKYFKFLKSANTKNYKLVINCDFHNEITKKFFFRRFNKNYKSYAHTTLIEHKKIENNSIASQIFTKKGPLAFLPISKNFTSVVYSARGGKDIDLEKLIKKYNVRYKIINISNSFTYELKSSLLRSYYFENILAFGDLLHKIHPLAGQGFNMSIRDIDKLLQLIKEKRINGLDLDTSICSEFEKNTKHKNFLFSSGIDFIYEFFNFESKYNFNFISQSIHLLSKNKGINKFFIKIADKGLMI